jgi:hypothetical protein
MTSSEPPPYLEQYRRVCRAESRVLKLANALTTNGGSTEDHLEYEDAVIAFFQHAWHLKDWIRNDPSISVPLNGSVLSRFESDIALGVCADIANGTKHFLLTRRRLGAALSKPGAANPNPSEPEWEIYVALPQIPGQTSGLHAAGALRQVMSAIEHAMRPNGLLRDA